MILFFLIIYFLGVPLFWSSSGWGMERVDLPSIQETISPLVRRSLGPFIEKYHAIPKNNVSFFGERISILKEMIQEARGFSANLRDPFESKELSFWVGEAQEKVSYLQQLVRFSKDLKMDFACEKKEPFFSEENRSRLICLKQERSLYLEVVDPWHRNLKTVYQFWNKHIASNVLSPPLLPSEFLSFFLWLETQTNLKNFQKITYFSKEEAKKQYSYGFSEGKFFKTQAFHPSHLGKESGQKFLFILDLYEQLFIAPETHSIQHTSLSLGEPVLMAGYLNLEKGVLTHLICENPYYEPAPIHLLAFFQFLQRRGVFFDPQRVWVEYVFNGKKADLPAADWIRLFSNGK